MRHNYFVICEWFASIDGKPGLFGVFDAVGVPTIGRESWHPVPIPDCVAVSTLYLTGADPEVVSSEFRLVDEDGVKVGAWTVVGRSELAGRRPDFERQFLCFLKMQGVSVPRFGTYALELHVNGARLCDTRLIVEERNPPPVASTIQGIL